MPNGHGGVPFLAGPIAFSIAFAVLVSLPPKVQPGWWWVAGCVMLAALAGWRLAYNLHMRNADEYGGGYTPPDVYRRAARRYWALAPVYAILAGAMGFGIVWWRGLP